jgi:acyl-CoA reductase-like NAD-dependent aldehyde dehydrogenase
MKIIPALVSGNTTVVKPSPLAPLTATSLLQGMAMELPRGVLNVVNGDGDVGNALVSSSAVGKIAFTGSNEVAGLIQSASAQHSTPALFELGGNDVAIVLADAPLSDADLARLVMASFLTSGQVCMAVKRILVADTRFDDFLTRYLEIAEELLIMGDPATNSVTVGPLVTAAHRARVTQIVDQSVGDDGETITLGRSLVEEHRVASGYFMHPRCVVGAPLDSRLWAEEQFGPVVPIRTFSTVEEAIVVANDTPFGLCASLWTADEGRAFDVARQLDVGTVFVNAHGRSGMSLTTPFGGVKASGHGRELGLEGIEEFAQTQVISCLEQPHSDDLRQASRYA